MEKTSFIDLIISNRFNEFIALFENFKDALAWLMLFEKLIENLINKNDYTRYHKSYKNKNDCALNISSIFFPTYIYFIVK